MASSDQWPVSRCCVKAVPPPSTSANFGIASGRLSTEAFKRSAAAAWNAPVASRRMAMSVRRSIVGALPVLLLERPQALDADDFEAAPLEPNEGFLGRDLWQPRPRERHRQIGDDPARTCAHAQDAIGEE